MSPARSQPESSAEVSLGARAHTRTPTSAPTHPPIKRRNPKAIQPGIDIGPGTSKQQRAVPPGAAVALLPSRTWNAAARPSLATSALNQR